MKIYCLKCKSQTDTKDEKEVGNSIKGNCAVCGTKKNKFMKGKGQKGAGVADKLLDSGNLPELHLHTPWSGRHRYTGPGTKFEKYVDKDLNPLPGHEPINKTDAVSYRHDKAYHQTEKLSKTEKHKKRDEADIKMLNELSDIIKDKKNKWGERTDARIAYAGIWLKRKLGLGTRTRKNRKH